MNKAEHQAWLAMLKHNGASALAAYFASKSFERFRMWAIHQPLTASHYLHPKLHPYIGRGCFGLQDILHKQNKCFDTMGKRYLGGHVLDQWQSVLRHMYSIETPQQYNTYLSNLAELPRSVNWTDSILQTMTEPWDTMTLYEHAQSVHVLKQLFDTYQLHTTFFIKTDVDAAYSLQFREERIEPELDVLLHQYQGQFLLKAPLRPKAPRKKPKNPKKKKFDDFLKI